MVTARSWTLGAGAEKIGFNYLETLRQVRSDSAGCDPEYHCINQLFN
ncbi:hypothetical protein BN938_0216 [Mucinivorans hirudinis]|uniref:Uncharacterized protein n=1 Tax=Mucinivorans hirudinis TaxID=1433126 RepID=A0A060R621_9BACT|nr:hypothetical protein BN938_0216 [Mucinivorans hirudinis]